MKSIKIMLTIILIVFIISCTKISTGNVSGNVKQATGGNGTQGLAQGALATALESALYNDIKKIAESRQFDQNDLKEIIKTRGEQGDSLDKAISHVLSKYSYDIQINEVSVPAEEVEVEDNSISSRSTVFTEAAKKQLDSVSLKDGQLQGRLPTDLRNQYADGKLSVSEFRELKESRALGTFHDLFDSAINLAGGDELEEEDGDEHENIND